MRIILVAFTLMLSTSFFGQNQMVKFSGCIENPNNEEVAIYGPNRYRKVIKLSEGCFSDTLMVPRGNYSFSDGNESTALYLEPGYDLKISLNTEQFDETIIYKGIGDKPNNFLAKYYLYNEQKVLGYKTKESMTELEYFNHQSDYFKGLYQLLSDIGFF